MVTELVRLKYMEYEGGTVGMLLSHALWQKNKEYEWCTLLLLLMFVRGWRLRARR